MGRWTTNAPFFVLGLSIFLQRKDSHERLFELT